MNCRHYIAYTGIRLPYKFVNEISDEELNLRNTYFKAYYDKEGKMTRCEKIVYGEVEFTHNYDYYADGVIKRAEILEAGEGARYIHYHENGFPIV